MPSIKQFNEEKKQVTILFADIKGSTALADGMEPEFVFNIINPTIAQMVKCIHEFNGIVIKKMGDGIMAVFGVESTHKQPVLSACAAGLFLQEQILDLSNKIEARVGIHTGEVILYKTEDGQYDLIGDAVNLTSRIESLTLPGAVFISEPTYFQVENLTQCDFVGSKQVKGKKKAINIYRLNAITHKAEQFSSIIGREEESHAIKDKIQLLSDDKGFIVTLVGQSGIGKTHLLQSIKYTINQPNTEIVLWLEGNSESIGQSCNRSYQAIISLYLQLLDLNGITDSNEIYNKLYAYIFSHFEESIAYDIFPYITMMFGLSSYLDKSKFIINHESAANQVLRANFLFFKTIAKITKLVVVIEDMHCIDGSSTKILSHLIPLIEQVALGFIFVVRTIDENSQSYPVFAHASKYQSNSTKQGIEIHLSTLSTEEIEVFIQQHFNQQASQPLINLLVDKSEGIPLYLEEFIKTLKFSKLIEFKTKSNQWQLVNNANVKNIPANIIDNINARIDQLDENFKMTLKIASVIGQKFLYKVLVDLVDDNDLEQVISNLESNELIVKDNQFNDVSYFFQNSLIHDSIYHTVLSKNRFKLHHQIALSLEQLFEDRLDQVLGLLAYHYTSANNWNKAQYYLLKAAEYSNNIAADSETLVYYQNALNIHNTYSVEQKNSPEGVKLQAYMNRRLSEIYFRSGNFNQSLKYATTALNLLGERYPKKKTAIYMALIEQYSLYLLRVLRKKNSVNNFVQSSHQNDEIVRIYDCLGWSHFFSNPACLMLDSIKLLHIGFKVGSADSVSKGMTAIGYFCDVFGWYAWANYHHKKSIEFSNLSKDPSAIAFSQNALIFHLLSSGQLSKANNKIRKSISQCWELGNIHLWASTMTSLITIQISLGNYKEALSQATNLILRSEELSDDVGIMAGNLFKGFTLCKLMEFEKAERHLEFAYKNSEQSQNILYLSASAALLGLCYLHLSKDNWAFNMINHSIQCIRQNRLKGNYASFSRNAIASAYLLVISNRKDNDKVLNNAPNSKIINSFFKEIITQVASFKPSLVESYRLRANYYHLLTKKHKAIKDWRLALQLAKQFDMPNEITIINDELLHHHISL